MLHVSEHIDYATAIRSDAAKRAGLNNYFTPEQLGRMKIIAEKVYEPLVKHFKQPVYISSFFRSKEVNKLVGGTPDSQHLSNNGSAMDLDADMNPGISNKQVFDYIKDLLDHDQLILEDIRPDGTIGWVHVSYTSKEKNRHEVLTMVRKNGKTTYESYKNK
jgi:hypothetical protein